MKSSHSTWKVWTNAFLLISTSVFFFSCAAVNESPTRFGLAVVTMPGVQIGESRNSAHAVVGYYNIPFKGGGGHNNFLQFGGQVRRELTALAPNGLWAGGELTYVRISNKIDGSSMKPNASGFTIGPAVGYNLMLGQVPINIYGVASFFHRGKFDTGGESGNGYLGRVAFDIPFMRILSKKGR